MNKTKIFFTICLLFLMLLTTSFVSADENITDGLTINDEQNPEGVENDFILNINEEENFSEGFVGNINNSVISLSDEDDMNISYDVNLENQSCFEIDNEIIGEKCDDDNLSQINNHVLSDYYEWVDADIYAKSVSLSPKSDYIYQIQFFNHTSNQPFTNEFVKVELWEYINGGSIYFQGYTDSKGIFQFNLKKLPVGEYDVYFTWRGYDFDSEKIIKINKYPVNFILNSKRGTTEKTILKAIIKDKKGKLINEGYVNFIINKKSYHATVHKGIAKVKVSLPYEKIYAYKATFSSDNYSTKTATSKISVKHSKVKVSVKKIKARTANTPFKFTARYLDGKPLNVGFIKLKINKKTYKIKVKNGIAKKKIKFSKAKVYPYKVNFVNKKYATKIIKSKINVKQSMVKIKTFGGKTFTAKYALLKAHVKHNGNYVDFGSVKFAVNGKIHAVKVHNGVAKKKIKLSKSGIYKYKAKFYSKYYLSKTSVSKINVKQSMVKIKTVGSKTFTVKYALLKAYVEHYDGNIVDFGSVKFAVNGKVHVVKVNAGVAKKKIKLSKPGVYKYKAKFYSKYYSSKTSISKIHVKSSTFTVKIGKYSVKIGYKDYLNIQKGKKGEKSFAKLYFTGKYAHYTLYKDKKVILTKKKLAYEHTNGRSWSYEDAWTKPYGYKYVGMESKWSEDNSKTYFVYKKTTYKKVIAGTPKTKVYIGVEANYCNPFAYVYHLKEDYNRFKTYYVSKYKSVF